METVEQLRSHRSTAPNTSNEMKMKAAEPK